MPETIIIVHTVPPEYVKGIVALIAFYGLLRTK